MAKQKRTLVQDLIGLTVASSVGGAAISVLNTSGVPAPLASGTGSLIGVGLLKEASDIGGKRMHNLKKKGGLF